MFTVFALKIKSFNNFENDTMKESVNKQNKIDRFVIEYPCNYSTGFDFHICLRTRKVTGTFEKWAPDTVTILLLTLLPRKECRDLLGGKKKHKDI